MRSTEIPKIRTLPLFAGLDDAKFDALTRAAYLQAFPPQIDLIHEGDPADFLHVVVEGAVELFAAWNGRETTMATVLPISSFILAATIRDGPYLMSARTLERSRVLLIPSVDIRATFQTDAGFAQAIVQELAQCYRSVVKSSKDLKLRTSVERLANYLIRQQHRAGDAAAFDLPIEKRKLASYLGMTPENLSRSIRTLRGYGVVIEGSRVEILDMNQLLHLARPTILIDDPSS